MIYAIIADDAPLSRINELAEEYKDIVVSVEVK